VEEQSGDLVVTDLTRMHLIVPKDLPIKRAHVIHGHEFGEIAQQGGVPMLQSPTAEFVVHLLSRLVARLVQRRTLRYGDHDGLQTHPVCHLVQHDHLVGHVHPLHAIQLVEIVRPTQDDDQGDAIRHPFQHLRQTRRHLHVGALSANTLVQHLKTREVEIGVQLFLQFRCVGVEFLAAMQKPLGKGITERQHTFDVACFVARVVVLVVVYQIWRGARHLRDVFCTCSCCCCV